MNEAFESLVNSLRTELQEYGGLLHLFEEQQVSIVGRNPAVFLTQNDAVDAQIQKVTECREQREKVVGALAAAMGWPEDSSLSSLMTDLPAAVRPMLQALIDEINSLIAQAQRRTHQNRMLLAQAVDLAKQRLSIVDPHALPGTYSAQGALDGRPSRSGGFSAQVA
jgi:flagellar biosynthesis/type III secretory pathway chaperone